ncbi:MAG TPA: hypothetical protein VGA22_01695 [Gemmatimonadales bacterium]|jgi:hypothetical protein
MSDRAGSPARLQFRPRNVTLLAAALISVGVGYALLARGDTTVAPILLVLGYCVLFPLGLGL